MISFLDFCKQHSTGRYSVEVYPFYRIEDYIKIAKQFFEEQAKVTGIFDNDLDMVRWTTCTGFVVRNENHEVVAVNDAYYDFGEDRFINISFSNPSFRKDLGYNDIVDIVCSVGLPVDWVAFPHIERTFPSQHLKRYRFKLPDSLMEYVESLNKKHRTEYRKYIKRHLFLEDYPVERLLSLHSKEELARRISYTLGYSYFVILSRLETYLADSDLKVIRVSEKGRVLGYNFVRIKDDVLYDLCLAITDDEQICSRDGLYFSVIYSLITRSIFRKEAAFYDLSGGCNYKSKFIPQGYDDSRDTHLIGVNNFLESLPDIYHDSEFMKGFDFNKARLGVRQ